MVIVLNLKTFAMKTMGACLFVAGILTPTILSAQLSHTVKGHALMFGPRNNYMYNFAVGYEVNVTADWAFQLLLSSSGTDIFRNYAWDNTTRVIPEARYYFHKSLSGRHHWFTGLFSEFSRYTKNDFYGFSEGNWTDFLFTHSVSPGLPAGYKVMLGKKIMLEGFAGPRINFSRRHLQAYESGEKMEKYVGRSRSLDYRLGIYIGYVF